MFHDRVLKSYQGSKHTLELRYLKGVVQVHNRKNKIQIQTHIYIYIYGNLVQKGSYSIMINSAHCGIILPGFKFWPQTIISYGNTGKLLSFSHFLSFSQLSYQT